MTRGGWGKRCQIKRRDQRGEGVTVLPRVIVV